ncbi:hypothetical protein OROMI_015127 [Orobanche minor]
MKSDASKSKNTKRVIKQANLRQFIFKKTKSQWDSCSSLVDGDNVSSHNVSIPPDPPQEIATNLGGISVNSFPLEKMGLAGYSIEKDAAFCFVCYLFKHEIEANAGGDAFVNGGFKSWNKPDRFTKYVGGVKSLHNLAYEKYVNLRDEKKKSIVVSFDNVNDVSEKEHVTHNEAISKVTLENAPINCQLIAPQIQKDITNCCAKETTNLIMEELGNDYFAILADDSSDMSQKEQLALCLRYIEGKTGKIVERFIGLVHVGDTTSLSLKNAIVSLLVEHSLSPPKIRGQGYDGASSMKGEIHGLKTLIRQDTPK